jgi:hypothetical protein
MGSRFVSAVAFYGAKAGPLRDFLAGVRAVIAEHIGDDFRPYSLEQIHATLIALDGAVDPGTGKITEITALADDPVPGGCPLFPRSPDFPR